MNAFWWVVLEIYPTWETFTQLYGKLCGKFHVCDGRMHDRTIWRMHKRTYERKGENYIPLGIHAGGIMSPFIKGLPCSLHAGIIFDSTSTWAHNTNFDIARTCIWAMTWQNQQSDCAPSEDSDQPGHSPSLIREFAIMKKAWVLSYPLSAQRRLWSDWADAQGNLSLHWVHSHFVGFVMSRLTFRTWFLTYWCTLNLLIFCVKT